MCNKHTAVDRQRTPPEAASSKVPKTQDDGQQTILVKPAQTDLPVNIILYILVLLSSSKIFSFSKYIIPIASLVFSSDQKS